jgi:dTDP-glucose pyrophosphorylase
MIKFPELKKFIIKDTCSIQDAIKAIDLNGHGVCLVVDRNINFKGLLTDGDIRRLLLKGSNLSHSIKKKTNKSFFINKKDLFKIDLKKKLKKYKHIPVLNKKKIYSLLLEEDFIIKKKSNFIFILAGGLGSRMGNLTKKLPKPMLKINKKPILEHQINFFKKKGFYNFLISVNYLSKKIINYFKEGKKFGVNITYCEEKFSLGTAGPLSLIKRIVKKNEDIFVINGDIIADIDFDKILAFHKSKNYLLTLCAKKQQYKFPYGVINKNKKTINFIDEKPELDFLVNSGIYIINTKVLKFLKFHRFIDMNLFINNLKKKNKKIGVYLLYEKIFDIGNKSQYSAVKNIFN